MVGVLLTNSTGWEYGNALARSWSIVVLGASIVLLHPAWWENCSATASQIGVL